MGKKKLPQLKIVFDTNALFTKIAHQLFRSEVTDLIERHSGHADLSISWHIPETVMEERRHQMITRANGLLPHLQKVESLLGHNLGISEDILSDRVDAVIASQLDGTKLNRLELDTDAVSWRALIQRAVRRKPPFDPGDKEKGFRDAIVAETFLQMVANSPTTPSVCRVILITGDKLVREYVESMTQDRKNVYVLPGVSELDDLINTLASAVTEEFVSAIRDECGEFFFVKDNEATLFYKEALQQKIQDTFAEKLAETTGDATGRDNGGWWIPPPVFVRKEKQRVFWYTDVIVDATAYRNEIIPFGQPPSTVLPPSLAPSPLPRAQLPPSLALPLATKRVEVAKGKSWFHVQWSVNVSQRRALSSYRLGEITYRGTKWETDEN